MNHLSVIDLKEVSTSDLFFVVEVFYNRQIVGYCLIKTRKSLELLTSLPKPVAGKWEHILLYKRRKRIGSLCGKLKKNKLSGTVEYLCVN